MKGNQKNLIPNKDRTPEELREITRKGGERSGEVRRQKKKLRELAEMFGALKVEGNNAQKMAELGIPESEQTRFMQGVVALFNKANKGDVAAFNAIRDLIGEKPVDETKLTGNLDTRVEIGYVETGVEPVSREEDVDV